VTNKAFDIHKDTHTNRLTTHSNRLTKRVMLKRLDKRFPNCGRCSTSGTRRPSKWYAAWPALCLSSQTIYSQLQLLLIGFC